MREEIWEFGVAEGHVKIADPRVKTKYCQMGLVKLVKPDELMVSQMSGD